MWILSWHADKSYDPKYKSEDWDRWSSKLNVSHKRLAYGDASDGKQQGIVYFIGCSEFLGLQMLPGGKGLRCQ